MFEAAAASSVMADFSHLGLIHRKDAPTFSLIRLPKSFVELYGIVNKVKGREDSATLDEADDVGNSETAICLLTGAVMRSGSNRRAFARAQRPPGACTLHARKNGSGIGIFFLVQKCTVLLMHNNKSAYSASIYVDEHGEEDPGLRRGRPLFLNDARYRALEKLWRQQGIPREVAQIRSTSDRVIRDNWY
jgi:Proteolysis_6 C-terminal